MLIDISEYNQYMKIINIITYYIYSSINYIYNLIQNYFHSTESEYSYERIIEDLDETENQILTNNQTIPAVSEIVKETEKVDSFSLSNSWQCQICKKFNIDINIICDECEINPLIVPFMREIINQIDDISLNKIIMSSSKDICESTDESKLEDWEYLEEELLKEKIEYF